MELHGIAGVLELDAIGFNPLAEITWHFDPGQLSLSGGGSYWKGITTCTLQSNPTLVWLKFLRLLGQGDQQCGGGN